MNVDSLLKRYFNECEGHPLIEVFDNENIYNVYSNIVRSIELNPNEIVENRTDCESQFNEEFAPTDDLEQLW